tara:strand:+ start:11620 stop:13920 length:2301 start_codon:yes stop_codon:yes gene_type:complete
VKQQYVKHINKMKTKLYQNGGKTKSLWDMILNSANTPDLQEFISGIDGEVKLQEVDENTRIGKIIHLVPDQSGSTPSGSMQQVQIGTYYISDGTDGYKKGQRVKGLPPVKGTVPRGSLKTGGIRPMQYRYGGTKKYQNAGFKPDPKVIDLNKNNPFGYEPGSRHFNRYQNWLDEPIAIRNRQADFFNPSLSGNFGIGQGTTLNANYSPAFLRTGPDTDYELSGLEGSRGSFSISPSLTSSMMYRGNIRDKAGSGVNEGTALDKNRTTLGLNYAYQHPLNKSGSLVGGIEGEIGSLLKGSNNYYNTKTGDVFNTLETGLNKGGYGHVQAGLGYYPQNSNWGIRGNIGYGTEKSFSPGTSYGGSVNYGPFSMNVGKDAAGWTGGWGVNIPLSGRTQKGPEGPFRRETGGMYDNTLSGAGQGTAPQLGYTSTIVGEETDPNIQAQRLQQLGTVGQSLSQEATGLRQSTEQQRIQDEALAEQEAMQAEAMAGTAASQVEGTANTLARGIGSTLFPEHEASTLGSAIAGGVDAYKTVRAANLMAKGAELSKAGGALAPGVAGAATEAAAKGAELTAKGSQMAFKGVPYAAPTAASTAADAAAIGSEVGGSAIGAGLKSFAQSGAGLGTIASLAGMGVSALADDDDPTKSNFGEYTGSVLQSAGTGATIGSLFPGPGTAIGAGLGALWGYGKQAFGTRKAAQAQRDYESEAAANRNEAIYDLNERVGSLYGSQLANIAAGNLAQKTISGQNLGRNVMYRGGGFMRGVPRYGY